MERYLYEKSVIDTMGFPAYFLITWDFINWAKNNDVPIGPGRGSGAGSLVAYETGKTTSYGIYNVQDRGQMFVVPAQDVYEGQIVGENAKTDDIVINPCKKKQLTAIRSAGADEKLLLTPAKIFTLEEAIEYITDDDLIEVTPKSIRLRKKILNTELRMKEMMRRRRELEAQKK